LATFFLFGYGSLIFNPERAESVIGMRPARLPRHSRSFNKVSMSRVCARAESFDAFEHDEPGFHRDGGHASLVLGTRPAPAVDLEGMAIEYPVDVWDDVIERTDRREGYDATRPALLNGYERHTRELVCSDDGSTFDAQVYLTNHHPRSAFRVRQELTIEERARILVNATPREPAVWERAGESRGLLYLQLTRVGLRGHGIVDPYLEAVASAAGALAGPWQALLSRGPEAELGPAG